MASQARRILNSVSGVARPGELVALLGPSGAGKTTLLAALAGRVTVSSGKVTVDGVSKHKGASSSSTSRKMPKQSVAFITQEDTMLTQLTVFETLWYASAVRLPGHFSQKVSGASPQGRCRATVARNARGSNCPPAPSLILEPPAGALRIALPVSKT